VVLAGLLFAHGANLVLFTNISLCQILSASVPLNIVDSISKPNLLIKNQYNIQMGLIISHKQIIFATYLEGLIKIILYYNVLIIIGHHLAPR